MTEETGTQPAPQASAAVRALRAALAVFIVLASLAWAADLYRLVGFVFLPEQGLAALLGTGLALIFLHFRARRGSEGGPVPWYDWPLAGVSLAVGWYTAFAYPQIIETFFRLPTDGIVCSFAFFLLVLEGLRRATGNALLIILLVFVAYSLLGHHVPGSLQTREVELDRLMIYLAMDTSGMLGLVMLVAVAVVIPFLVFGQLLLYSGGASFFNDLSVALMGRYRGGSAKISVTASSLFGSISGIVVSNILATGVITIPLMKRAGFRPEQAAAIEATASTGGQLMPPVMGAVAFLMADFLRVPYAEVAIAALVPSLLYYVALFIQADLEAAKQGIARVEESEIPRLRDVLRKGWFFALPFAVLIYALFWLNLEPEVAALYAALTVLAIGFTVGYGGDRMSPGNLLTALREAGNGALNILMIAAAAGFIMGILQATGLGFALTLYLVEVGGGSLIVLLIIAAGMCIVLGMGMPTLGVYVLLAVLVAPSLVEIGFEPMGAHMFILYMGMMSFITPPVAIAAFFAASVAGAEPIRTGFTAMRFGWTAYIVPFLFIFSPALLLRDPSITYTIVALVTAVGGVGLASAGMAGYLFRHLNPVVRAGLVVAGICLLIPDDIGTWAVWTDLTGAAIAAALVAYEVIGTRRQARGTA